MAKNPAQRLDDNHLFHERSETYVGVIEGCPYFSNPDILCMYINGKWTVNSWDSPRAGAFNGNVTSFAKWIYHSRKGACKDASQAS